MIRPQKPKDSSNWLYYDTDGGIRIFRKLVYLGKEAELWAECTNEEKEQWECEHPASEPEPIGE